MVQRAEGGKREVGVGRESGLRTRAGGRWKWAEDRDRWQVEVG